MLAILVEITSTGHPLAAHPRFVGFADCGGLTLRGLSLVRCVLVKLVSAADNFSLHFLPATLSCNVFCTALFRIEANRSDTLLAVCFLACRLASECDQLGDAMPCDNSDKEL